MDENGFICLFLNFFTAFENNWLAKLFFITYGICVVIKKNAGPIFCVTSFFTKFF